MSDSWILTEDALNRLLDWLDPNRESAGRKYEDLRRRLTQLFVCRGCFEADQLTDDTIDRVAKKVPQIADTYVGDPALYFFGVARKVHLEYLRKQRAASVPPTPPDVNSAQVEEEYTCLEHCMDGLTPDNRRLVLKYYQEEKQVKIDHRRELAGRLGIGMNALRLRVFRIRADLQQCVVNCMEKGLRRNGLNHNVIP
jgi:DNA-directed RNA polymerase specialized sigma24 family protein